MLTIAVCDGNKADLMTTKKQIHACLKNYEDEDLQVDGFAKPFDFLDVLGKGHFYDIYVLETEMVGFSGIELARDLRDRGIDKPILFVTNSRQYAFDAFAVDALQYLTKPVDQKRLSATLHRAVQTLHSERRQQVVFKTVDGYYHAFLRSILYTMTDGKYQLIRLNGGKELKVRCTATEMAQTLLAYPGFVRCGSSFTLNLFHIDRYDAKAVQMCDGNLLPVPRGAFAGINEAYLDCFSK